ncbi:MocE family 2Fe-2S type ferredoxin [Mesorhizobium sp. M1348]|uniref:MocE family 2Fe-2S type ferredoxin n=1 Tax=unclassified Mesorhizobium TaxID=325217 RepID=UPI003338A274
MPWVDACAADEIEAEEAKRFENGGRTFAIFRNDADEYYCTDGLCTHEKIHLADGLVMGNTVECPKHASVFDFTTGEVETPPACENLKIYKTKVENGRVMIEV